MSKENPAPTNRGAEKDSLHDLLERKGISEETIADWINTDEANIRRWYTGEAVPNANQCMWLAVILDCPLTEIYMAILNT